MGFAAYTGLCITALAALVLHTFPTQVLSLVTNNSILIEMGAPYLKIVGISYIFNAVSSVYVSMQRSAENPSLGMKIFACSMLLNTFLNYCLIFGNFGAPALGITGAAVATLISRIAEFLLVVLYVLFSRRVPLMPRQFLRPGRDTVRSFIRYATPVLLNETLWGLGTTSHDRHPGPYGRQRRHAGRLYHHGQYRQVHHRLLLRSGRCHGGHSG